MILTRGNGGAGRTRRGETSFGAMVAIVLLALSTVVLGAVVTYQQTRDRAKEKAIDDAVEAMKPYVEFDVKTGAGANTKPNIDTSTNKAALVETLADEYRKGAKEKGPKPTTVLVGLVNQQEELAKKLTGLGSDKIALDPASVHKTVAKEMKKALEGLKLNTGKREEIIGAESQVVHLTVPQALAALRKNYDEKVAELETVKKRVTDLDKAAAWEAAAAAVKLPEFEGQKDVSVDALVKKANDKPDATLYINTLLGIVKALSEKAVTEAKIAAEARASSEGFKKENDSARGKFVEDAKKASDEFLDKVSKTNKELEDERALHKAEVEKRDEEIARLKKVLTTRLQMLETDLRPDLILEQAGVVSSVNSQRKTVILNLSGRGVKGKVLPGYRFGVYVNDTKAPLIKETLKGKVEVVSVTGSFAEARVVEVARDQVIGEGDRIGNAFVNRQVRHVAMIGLFDSDLDGQYTDEETEQLKQQVARYGGVVDPELVETTDFVVIGYIPPIPPEPAPTASDLAKRNYKIAKDANEAKKRADELTRLWHIPVMNQNRLFDLIGNNTRNEEPRRN
jgi:hypothetical protein